MIRMPYSVLSLAAETISRTSELLAWSARLPAAIGDVSRPHARNHEPWRTTMPQLETQQSGAQPVRSHAKQMLQTHPRTRALDTSVLQCIEACFDCTQACIACADACLGEADPKVLTRCIRLNQDCATICSTTGAILSRQTEPEPTVVRAVLQACAVTCKQCAAECGQHAQVMKHCDACADACRGCEQACTRLLATG